MASVAIFNKSTTLLESINQHTFPQVSIEEKVDKGITIFNKSTTLLESINQHTFPQVSIEEKVDKGITINEFLPFRVRITDVDIVAFGANNAPPIPLQIIGVSNYIL